MNTPSQDTQQSINILAFDTSGDEASLALWVHNQMRTLTIPVGTGAHSQAARLIPMMKDLLSEGSIDFQDIHVIATPKGPGSFTGIRIGLATAQGLVSATQAAAFAPTTFEVAVFGVWAKQIGTYFVTIPTKRESFYCQGFDKILNPTGSASIMIDQEIDKYLTQNPHMIRVSQPSEVSAQALIELYLYKQKVGELNRSVTLLEPPDRSSSILHPYYLHDPEFVKQKPWSL